MTNLLEQVKTRRKQLGLKQKDMQLRVGISPQQYQRLEAKGNPRLDTLVLLAKGLNGELMFIPQENLVAVKHLLEGKGSDEPASESPKNKPTLADNPWQGILEDDTL